AALEQFLVELGRPGQLQPNPFLRGFYFCGTRPIVIQEQLFTPAPTRSGETSDAVKTRASHLDEQVDSEKTRVVRFDPEMTRVHSMQAAPRAPRFSVRTVQQWILLKDLFSTVLLADRAPVDITGSRSKANRLGRILLATGATAFVLLAAAFTTS